VSSCDRPDGLWAHPAARSVRAGAGYSPRSSAVCKNHLHCPWMLSWWLQGHLTFTENLRLSPDGLSTGQLLPEPRAESCTLILVSVLKFVGQSTDRCQGPACYTREFCRYPVISNLAISSFRDHPFSCHCFDVS
jgi:hypothetical protein